ncbi:putative Patatin [Nostocoides japonicum T1-X7]|uniref:Putative Patatin n=1 Tax=Nostocoides japonicum T1-X7 TaxID=1194083 RepID=A0A077M105_9MICO|nr:patatin-like protein [Tetrasphaera japonica]CCH78752.1 putative Patatin [Tetrasphaera japonica T1-X7]
MATDAGGLLGHDGLDRVPAEELRLAVVLNGGVSLAVWMGGTVLEIDRLVKAGQRGGGPPAYRLMLRLAGATARSDVIAGTSAGGINGAALALAQVNGRAHVGTLRDLWIDQGQIETLLRQPFRGAPSSLMRGDEYFLPQLNAALGGLATPLQWRSPAEAPIDLTMATTVLRGNQLVTTDALGQRMPQELHAARLRWSRWPIPETDAGGTPRPDPFSPAQIRHTAAQMALAARASASFPVAFEPTFVPVGEDLARTPRTLEDQAVRPDLDGVVESWGDPARTDRSRFTVDGGLLANTPTAYALAAIQAMPASGPVRRVLLLVYPHAPEPGLDPADSYADPPTLRATMTQVLGALSAQGGRTFVEEIEAHNRAASGRRGTRGDILGSVASDDGQTVESLAACLYPHYRRLRRWRAARDLAQRKLEALSLLPVEQQSVSQLWSYERIRRAAEAAQGWLDDAAARTSGGMPTPPGRGAAPASGGDGGVWVGLPYVPHTLPTQEHPDTGPGWGWGDAGAERIAEAAGDVVRRLIWVLPPGEDFDTVSAAYDVVSRTAVKISEARSLTDHRWDADPVLATLEPNQSYWAFRLGCYSVLMLGVEGSGLEALARALAQSEGGRVQAATSDAQRAKARHDAVLAALLDWLRVVRDTPASAGVRVRALVDEVVAEVRKVVPILVRMAAGDDGEATMVADRRLSVWADFLGAEPTDPATLLTRLLQLEVATTALGDEMSTGATVPVELVQLSAQTQNPFMRYTRTADDKLGGMSVMRFGGFLKRSWRLNDWMWGRLDAATVLALTVLQPARIRRAATLSGYLSSSEAAGRDPREPALATVDDVVTRLFGKDSPALADPRLEELRTQAVEELTACFDVANTPPGDLEPSMPGLAGLFAWAIHLDVVPEDTPALVGAIRADAVDGSNARSHGQFFLQQNDGLLRRVVEQVDRAGPHAVDPGDRVQLLTAFDRAGVGREPLEDEVSSDLLLRSATTAAAVTATTLDSPRSGLGAIRPVTRSVRGAMLVVFWAMTGLTSKGVLARSLALLGFATGGVLVVLSVFGALPSAIAAPASAIGVSLLLLAFAWGALRSGTMLHGLVLLTPVVPLVADAVDRTRTGTMSDGTSAVHGIVVVGGVVVFALGLMLLGTLPAAVSSPYASLGSLATRFGLPPERHPRGSTAAHLAEGILRRLRGIGRFLAFAWWRLLIVAVPIAIGAWAAGSGWRTVHGHLHDHWWWVLGVAAVIAGAGLLVAAYTGFALQSLTEVRVDGEPLAWRFLKVAHPAGVQAGWSAVYGAVYLAVGVLLVADPFGWRSSLWALSLCALCLVLGVVLSLVVPVVVPLWALSRVRASEFRRAASVPPFAACADDLGRTAKELPEVPADLAFVVDLVQRDRGYRWWVAYKGGDGELPTLKRRGVRLLRYVDGARPSSRYDAPGPAGPPDAPGSTGPPDAPGPAGQPGGSAVTPDRSASGATSG